MMKLLICLAFLAISYASPIYPNPEFDDFWTAYKGEHGKQYGGEAEEQMRRFIFEKNLRYIINHNYEADMGQHTFRLGMNEHGDLTEEEYHKFLTGFRGENNTTGNPVFLAPEFAMPPAEVDWRKKGYVTPVKNQEACGSCWAFSTTGSLEGQHFKKTGKLVSLSEQNLVDCSTKFGNHGCGGGLMDNAFRYIKSNMGIDTEASYPYTARDGTCHYMKKDMGATDTGLVDIMRGSEDDLQKAVATVGPISVAIDAHTMKFRFYKTGVYVDTECSSTLLDHGVLAVGYGEMDGQKYWTVKNSWGETYGMKGYILMARDHKNMCGIATQASYPLV